MSTHTDLAAVRAWSAQLLTRADHAGDIPPAGTRAWRALPDTDPRKPAAIVRAALAWLHESTHDAISARLHAELEHTRKQLRQQTKQIACDLSGATDWSRIATSPSHARLIERRTTYTTPARTAAEIRDQARASWSCDSSMQSAGGVPSQPSQASHCRSTRDGFTCWDGPSRPSTPTSTDTGTEVAA